MPRSPYRDLARVAAHGWRGRDRARGSASILLRVACEDGQIWWLALVALLALRHLRHVLDSIGFW